MLSSTQREYEPNGVSTLHIRVSNHLLSLRPTDFSHALALQQRVRSTATAFLLSPARQAFPASSHEPPLARPRRSHGRSYSEARSGSNNLSNGPRAIKAGFSLRAYCGNFAAARIAKRRVAGCALARDRSRGRHVGRARVGVRGRVRITQDTEGDANDLVGSASNYDAEDTSGARWTRLSESCLEI